MFSVALCGFRGSGNNWLRPFAIAVRNQSGKSPTEKQGYRKGFGKSHTRLRKNIKIERIVDIYDEDLFKVNVGYENLEKEMEKIIE